MTTETVHRLSVAPMMDWTDRHCRYFHRLLSNRVTLYTEMVTAAAVINGNRDRLIGFDPVEQPVVLQLGGSDPAQLAQAVNIGRSFGYREFNLNVGCPSDRVKSGCFGAVLMLTPELVADCTQAMVGAAGDGRVSVKCRIGVDDQVPEQVLPAFLDLIAGTGVTHFTIHARKAWLQGLSPKQNREVPPLDYQLVHAMKDRFSRLHITINGGVTTLDQAEAHLARGMDGVMFGRAAYHDPGSVLSGADQRFFGAAADAGMAAAIEQMLPYIEAQMLLGVRLQQITRHILGAFTGRPGARHWRQILSEGAHLPGAGPELVARALAQVSPGAMAAE